MAAAPVINWHEQEIVKSNPQAEAAESVKQQALAIRVTDETTQANAIEFAKRIKAKAAEIAAYWKPLKESAFKAHRALTAREGELLKPLSDGEAHLKREVATYQAKLEAARREERMRLEAEARQRAEEAREREIELAERMGASAVEVQAMAETPLAVEPVIDIAPPVAKPKGIAFPKTWKAEVTDKRELVAFCASNPSMLHLLVPDQSALNAMAKAMKSAGQIPGVRFYEEVSASLR